MIESRAKPSEVISDKAANRLLADIAVDIDQSAAWAARMVRERLGEPVTIDVYRTRTESRFDGSVTLGWRVSITSEHACVFGDSFAVLNEAVAKTCRVYETRRRVEREMAEVDAADKADKDTLPERFGAAWGKVNGLTGGPTNDATTDALPNYYPHTEVEGAMEDCPDCGRPDGMHISNGKGGYRCATEKEAAKYDRDIAEE